MSYEEGTDSAATKQFDVLTATAIPGLLIWQVVRNFVTVSGQFFSRCLSASGDIYNTHPANFKLSSTSLWKD